MCHVKSSSSRGPLTFSLTRISCSPVFSKSRNVGKAGTLCKCLQINILQGKSQRSIASLFGNTDSKYALVEYSGGPPREGCKGDFCVSRGPLTVSLTQISCNTFFSKSRNVGKAGTLCRCIQINILQEKKNIEV